MRYSRTLARGASCAIASVLASALSSAQSTWFVDAGAAPSGDGTSWATAFDSLQSALDVAVGTDRVWVAAGKYAPTNLENPLDPRSARFRIASGLRLFGGFDGTETIVAERDPALFDDTILSGDIGVPNDPSDNAYRILEFPTFAVPGFARVDGFRITGGNSNANGGAIVIGMTVFGYNPRARIYNCILNDNSAVRGGAIAAANFGVVQLSRCVVERNVASEHGGAIYCTAGGVLATNTRFLENKAGDQGGVLWANSNLLLGWLRQANCLYYGNRAVDGGAVYLKGAAQTAALGEWTNCTFAGNVATSTGGAFYTVTTTANSARAFLFNSILWDNEAPTAPSIFGTGNDVRYTDVEGGHAGTGNLNIDPQFSVDFQTDAGSPVNDAGSNSLVEQDFLDLDADGDVQEELPYDIADGARRVNDSSAADTGEGSAPIVDMGVHEMDPAHGG